jgi:putative ABC transport system substrate-binding protein
VSVIVANTPAARAAQAATKTIPIVFVTAVDPVAFGFVASLNRPGGNLTGVSSLVEEIGPKRLELVHELLPTTSVLAVLINPTNPTAETVSKDAQSAARALGQTVHILNASTEGEIDIAFARLAQLQAGALLVTNDVFFNNHPDQLVALAARHAIPVIYSWSEFVVAGGLMSYGTSLAHVYRQLAIYVARILKGEKPADLPVQQSTEVELIINMRTAKQLGLTVPIQLLGRADEIIE